jgi:carboxymethylenebutenolidase
MMNQDQVIDAMSLINATTTEPVKKNRREALRAAIGVGYALAATPIMAQTAINTTSDGLLTGEVLIDVDGFKIPAYRAAPQGKKNLPVVLVISEIFGVHEYIADVARRFAHEGYLAIAPDLFVRQGDPAMYGEMSKLISEVVSKVPDAQIMKDLDACASWATQNAGDGKHLYINGFCWGGRVSWLYAEHNPAVTAAVVWYGRMEGEKTEQNPLHPIDLVDQLHAPVLGLYGGADTGISKQSIDRMKNALAKIKTSVAGESEFVIYPDAPHAFHADYRSSYRESAAKDGFMRALAWFKSHIK